MRRARALLPALGALACSLAALHGAFGPASRVHFEERSPLARPDELARRYRIPLAELEALGAAPYDLAGESFELYAPPCTATARAGLIVWVSAHGSGEVPPGWVTVLDAECLVWVGADRSGNARAFWDRTHLALDAAHGARRRLGIDPERVYVAGFSGGGRMASELALLYPDVFRGGIFLLGAGTFRPVPSTERPGHVFLPAFPPPPPERLDRARAHPYVLIGGEHDPNRRELQDLFFALREDGFARLEILVVPGLGHELPGAEWLRRALAHLDGQAS